jgi:hypothetical protein
LPLIKDLIDCKASLLLPTAPFLESHPGNTHPVVLSASVPRMNQNTPILTYLIIA